MTKKRLLFVDLLRGWALLVMIEVHVFNGFLQQELKETSWFNALNFVNGLVAPSFIFISGFAFMLASQRKLPEFRAFGYQFWRQIGRIVLIWLVGYSIHLPFLSISKMYREATSEQWLNFMKVDVLQCIAAGLLLLFLLRLLIKSDRAYNITLLVMGVFVIAVSPLMWKTDFAEYIWLPAANYLNPIHNSLFPLFPWMAFMIAGALACSLYIKFKNDGKEDQFFRNILWVSAAVIIIAQTILTFQLMPAMKPNPVFFLERLAIVLCLLSFFRYYEIKRKTESSFVVDVGRESLLVYWLHLQVIYRKLVDDQSIFSIVNHSFNFWQCLAATILLVLLMVLAAKLWEMIKSRYRKLAQAAVVVTVVGAILIFLLR